MNLLMIFPLIHKTILSTQHWDVVISAQLRLLRKLSGSTAPKSRQVQSPMQCACLLLVVIIWIVPPPSSSAKWRFPTKNAIILMVTVAGRQGDNPSFNRSGIYSKREWNRNGYWWIRDRWCIWFFCLFGVDVAKAKYYDIRCTLIPSQLQPVFLLEMFI